MQLAGNLLIVGDSFCEIQSGWPGHLHAQLDSQQTTQFHCQGFPGGSWWKIKQYVDGLNYNKSEFMKQLEYAVIIHPHIHRPIQSATEWFPPAIPLPRHYDNKTIPEDQLAISLYYKYIDNPDFQIWAFQKWAEEVETLFASHVKLVHLVTSQQALDLLPAMRGQVVTTPLNDLAAVQYANGVFTGVDTIPDVANHFSPENNMMFAQEIQRVISTGATQINIDRFKL